MATVHNPNFCADNGLTNANALQNKKRSNATQKPNPSSLVDNYFNPRLENQFGQTTFGR